MLHLVLGVLSLMAAAETKPAAPALDYSGQDWIVEREERRIRFDNDGTGQEEEFRHIHVLTEAGVRAFGQLVKSYDSAREQLEFRDVRVRKADGRVVVAPLTQVIELTAPVAASFPIYSDLRQKHLSVPDLRPGDVLEYAVTRTLKTPLAPGHFWVAHTFDRFEIVLDEFVEISVPLDRTLKMRIAEGFTPAISEASGRRLYRFTHKMTQPAEVEAGRRRLRRQVVLPSSDVALSTFQTWGEVADWYEGLQRDQVAPTPAIREKAAQITRGLHEDLDKIHAIYDYVATQVRYVSISLGDSAVRPHPAEETLSNGYGDCKDKHTLLAALLAAAGVEAHAALIGASIDLDPAVPYLQFNHVITVVPLAGEYLWLDTTSEVAPFLWLSPQLRAKQSLLVAAGGTGHLVDTPRSSAIPNEVLTDVTGTVGDDGRLVAHRHETYQGDLEVPVRLAFRLVPQDRFKQGIEKGLQAQAEALHLTAALGDFKAGDPAATRGPMTFDLDYTVPNAFDPSANSPSLGLPGPNMRLPPLDDLPHSGPGRLLLGGPLTMRARSTIELPTGWSPRLPDAVSIAKDFAEYHAEYAFEGRTLRVEHVLTFKSYDLPEQSSKDYEQLRDVVRSKFQQSFTLRNRAEYQKACESGKGEACSKLASMYERGDGVDKDDARAADLYEKGCGSGDAGGCNWAGIHYHKGTGVGKDLARAAALYEKACAGGDADGCGRLGSSYDHGEGVEKDPARAAALYQKGCDGGEGWVCGKVAFAYDSGMGVPKDVARAATFYQKGCESGDAHSCSNLGYDYENGLGVSRDQARAATLYQKACDQGDADGCNRLASAYEDGHGVEKDPARAAALYQKGCDGGSAWGCSKLAYLYDIGSGVAKDVERAAALYRKACDGGHARGCMSIGVDYEHGIGVPKDEERAVTEYQKACAGGDAAGCSRLGSSYAQGRGVAKDETKAAELFQEACDADDGWSCGALGSLYQAGHGVDQDLVRGATLFQKACDLGEVDGCSSIGIDYIGGVGVPQDVQRGVGFFQKACDGGSVEQCYWLGEAYWHGAGGVRRDKERAASLLQKACEGGIVASCSTLGLTYSFHSRDSEHPSPAVLADDARALALFKKGCDGGDPRGCSYLGSLYRYGTGVPKDMARYRALAKKACDAGYQPACDELKTIP